MKTKHTIQLIATTLAALVMLPGCDSKKATPVDAANEATTTQEARQLAEEAYIFAYSMLENYKTMYAQAVNKDLPTFGAPFNQFSHRRALLDPTFTEVVAPNNDTLYYR